MKGLDREAIQLAEWVRRATGCVGLPTDIDRIAERLGLGVFRRKLPRRVYAVSEMPHRMIVLNSMRPRRQQRYDLAHEVGEHLTLSLGVGHGSWHNQFAGHLLVPLNELHGAVRDGQLERICNSFDVSESVILYQMGFLKAWLLSIPEKQNSTVRSGMCESSSNLGNGIAAIRKSPWIEEATAKLRSGV